MITPIDMLIGFGIAAVIAIIMFLVWCVTKDDVAVFGILIGLFVSVCSFIPVVIDPLFFATNVILTSVAIARILWTFIHHVRSNY